MTGAFHADPPTIRAYAGAVADAGAVVTALATAVPQPGLPATAFGRVAQDSAGAAFEGALRRLQDGVLRVGSVLQQTVGGLSTAAATYEREEQAGTAAFQDLDR